MWELTALAAHAHPSVSAMARSLLSGAPVMFDGDPLRDLSLAAFLDKFVSKKPKVRGWVGGAEGGAAAEEQQQHRKWAMCGSVTRLGFR